MSTEVNENNIISSKTLIRNSSPTKSNDRIIKDNQMYKMQIINLNDKINELNINFQNEKNNLEKKENELKEKNEKEIKQ